MIGEKMSITIEQKSIVNGKEIAGLRALITSKEDIVFLHYEIDKEACKTERNEFRKDKAEFEDNAYAMQEELFK